MAPIIKTYREDIPAMRFIGKSYPGFGGWWGEWFANGWFDEIECAMGGTEAVLKIWPSGGGYVGLERHCEGEPFEYWLGMFVPANTPVPEGFAYVDFPATGLGTCWIYGKEGEVHDTSACRPLLIENGMRIWKDIRGGEWSFENCLCPRYTTPDEQGNIIMDYCYFVE